MRTTQRIKIPNRQKDIEQFWAKVYINGRLIDQKGDYALMEYAGKTYEVNKARRGGISKMDSALWYATKDDIPEPEPEPAFEMPSDDELVAMTAEMEAM